MKTAALLKCFQKIIILAILLESSSRSQNPEQSIMDVNNITSWVRNDGFHDWLIRIPSNKEGWNGLFPKGSAATIFCEGLLWGGKVFDKNPVLIRAGGSEYKSANVPITRLFRVMPFFREAGLTNDASNFFNVPERLVTDSMINQLNAQYEKDWNEWPAERGAPYYDINKNGKYEPYIDIPGIPGASQTIWINYNDSRSDNLYQCPPIGLEIQETYWAYAGSSNYGINSEFMNVIFKHANIIYKGSHYSTPNSYIDSMYVNQWVDQELGNPADDLLGCDTLLNMGYAYNARDFDNIYNEFLSAPPAVGTIFLQGTAHWTGNPLDSAVVNFKWRRGYKYFHEKPLTVFIAFKIGDTWGDPEYNYFGGLELYNYMRGYFPYPPYPESQTKYNQFGIEFGGYGTYMNSGDPITGSGWVDGISDPPGPRHMYMINGPLSLKQGDTVEIVLATVGGLGTNHLNSITDLRYRARQAAYLYELFVRQMTDDNLNPEIPKRNILEDYVLHQNYPNPFNSSTFIKYELPEPALVKLVVYDMLGSVVKVLVNENKGAGKYRVEFNPSGLARGVYIYRITFENSSSRLVNDGLTKTSKLLFIK
ncbi:MAG: T9SS type A sorting domain-containing protein [Ignavibacteria bacterium]